MAPTPVHNRKYLCQAPRNEIWDNIRDGVIAHLGDDPAAVLRTTIDQVRSLHPELERPRSGPGRKSNAEHALFFYQYLLHYVENNQHRHHHHHPPPDHSNDHHRSQLPATTSITPSSDFCNVCQDDTNPEPLIPCRSCPRAFHMASCLHPQVDGDYEDWLCPYCVLEDPRTPKLKRHPAAAAVRVMARWRKQFARKRAAATAQQQQEQQQPASAAAQPDTTPTTSTDPPVVVPPGVAEKLETEPVKNATQAEEKREETTNEQSVAEERNAIIASEQHRAGGESKMVDAGDAAVAVEQRIIIKDEEKQQDTSAGPAVTEADRSETPTPSDPKTEADTAASTAPSSAGPSSPDRSRRTRKQPTLYDPQSCAASQWATDELWKTTSPKESEDAASGDKQQPPPNPTMVPSSHPAKPSVRQSVLDSGEGYWCNFCRDDPAISLCVFCACRVCYSKETEDQLVCSDCDQQYHAKCIGLPRPKAMSLSWTCASCIEAKKPQKNRVVPTRTRPREPSKRSETTAASEGPSRRSARAPAPRRVDPPPAERKSPAKRAAATAPVVKRPVGRPPKNRPPAVAAADLPRKRGRPPAVGPPRKRGRPPKKPKMTVEVAESDDGMLVERTEVQGKLAASPAGAIHTTRTGRTVRRSTFHDEIEQGAQFLKSSRKSPKSSPNDTSYGGSFRSTEAAAPSDMDLDATEPAAAAPVKAPPAPPVRQESSRNPRRKPGARECMQISRRFGDKVIPDKYYDILMDYCNRGKVEHLIRMRERLDEHSRFLELQLAGLETLVQERGESNVVVPLLPEKSEG